MKRKDKDFIIDKELGLNVSDSLNDIQQDIEKVHIINKDETQEEFKNIIKEKSDDLQPRINLVKELEKEESTSLKDISLDPKSNEFIDTIKDNVTYCVDELKDVDQAMNKIYSQKNSELFFKKSESIKIISQYMAKMANVNQKTLDLLILLLGASGKISEEYDTILTTIDELSELNNGEAEVLKYLLKVKNMVYEIKDNDDRLKQVMDDNAKTMEIVTKADEGFKEEINQSSKSRKLIESKCNRLQRKLVLNNIYIGICLLIIIALSIFVGLKFYVL